MNNNMNSMLRVGYKPCYRSFDCPLPVYKTTYPRSFVMKPHHGFDYNQTLYQTSPAELTFQDWHILNGHWHTTTGLAHDKKIQDPLFQTEIIVKAPSCAVMHRIFPNVQEQMKFTSQRLMYGTHQVHNYSTVTKTDFIPRRAICDFDFDNGPLVQVPKRYTRVSKKTMHKPKFDQDEMFSIARKFHPYTSITKIDYRDPTKEKDKYEGGETFCSIKLRNQNK